MKLGAGAAAVIALVAACRRQEPSSVPASADTSVLLDRLAWSCQPEAVAQMVLIASSSSSRELRCRAMSEIYGHHPLVFAMNPVWIHAGVVQLEQPPLQQALRSLLADPDPWCFHPRGTARPRDAAGKISPRETAAVVLASFPVPGFEADLERAFSEEQHANRAQQAKRVQLALDAAAMRSRAPETPRTDRVDALVAAGTPEAFERLVDLVASGFPRSDGAPPVSPEELDEVNRHVRAALDWLAAMVGHVEAEPPDPAWGPTRERELRDAIAVGPLGVKLMDTFERFDPIGRNAVIDAVAAAKPAGYREWLEQVARDDPDRELRDAARRAQARAR